MLCTYEAVAGCTVFACPHDDLGEAVAVAVVETPGAGVTLRDLRSHMLRADQIQSKWLPECLVIVPRLPKGPTGKPQRIGLANVYGLPSLSHRGNASLGATWKATESDEGGEHAFGHWICDTLREMPPTPNSRLKIRSPACMFLSHTYVLCFNYAELPLLQLELLLVLFLPFFLSFFLFFSLFFWIPMVG